MSIDENVPGGHASFMSLSEAAELLGSRENLLEALSAGRLRSIGVAIRGGDPQASRGAPPIVIPPGTYIGATVIWNEGRVVPAPEHAKEVSRFENVGVELSRIDQAPLVSPVKRRYQPRFVSLHEALLYVGSKDDLLAALRDGAVCARGQKNWPYYLGNNAAPLYQRPERQLTGIPMDDWLVGSTDWLTSSLTISNAITKLTAVVYLSVQVDRTDLDVLFPTIDAEGPQKDRRRGGRPPAYDWQAFDQAFIEFVASEHPAAQGDVERFMKAWCEKHWKGQPDDRTIEKRVAELCKKHAVSFLK
jgi:hypothetical protein